jgi:O-antigen ligase
LDLWRTSPWIGVGVTGRGSGSEEFSDVNGHNLIIDALGVYGLGAAILVFLILVISLALGALSARAGEFAPIIMTITYITIGLTQSDYNWTVVSVPWIILVLSVLLAAATINAKKDSSEALSERSERPDIEIDE